MTSVVTKRCPGCGEEKPRTTEFWHIRNDVAGGLRSRCKACASARNAIYYATNSERIATYRSDNREHKAAYNANYYANDKNGAASRMSTYRAVNIKKEMLRKARKRAAKAGVPFAITSDDIQIPDRCPVLDIALSIGKGRFHNGSPTLDRLIPALGYVKGNVAVISYRANRIKNDATPLELKAVADYAERLI